MNNLSITRAFWHYTIPATVAMLISGLYVVVDGIFIGQAMGASGLSAIYLAWPLNGVIIAIGLMIGMGSGARCSIAMGSEKWEEARCYLAQALWLLILLGIPSGLLVVLSGKPFLSLQGAEATLAQLGNDYLQVIGWASPIVFGSVALPLLVRNLGAPRLATVAMLIGAIANVILDYYFIIVLQWGLRGAALATVLGESLSVIICLIFILSKYNPLQIRITALKLNLKLSISVLKTGFSSMLMYLYMSIVVILHNLLLMHYGSSIQVAAYAITGYLMSIYYMFAEGITAGMQPLISYYYGASRLDKVRRVLKLGMLTGIGIGIIFTGALLAFPTPFVELFSGNDEPLLLGVSIEAVRLHLFTMFLDAFIILAACFFQAMGQVRKATMITVSNMLILLPFLAIMPLIWGLNGVWIALPMSNILLSVIVALMLINQIKKMQPNRSRFVN